MLCPLAFNNIILISYIWIGSNRWYPTLYMNARFLSSWAHIYIVHIWALKVKLLYRYSSPCGCLFYIFFFTFFSSIFGKINWQYPHTFAQYRTHKSSPSAIQQSTWYIRLSKVKILLLLCSQVELFFFSFFIFTFHISIFQEKYRIWTKSHSYYSFSSSLPLCCCFASCFH